MMDSRILPVVAAIVTLAVILQLLRRRQLREKYAILWVGCSAAVAIIAIFPRVLSAAAEVLGVRTPANLLFFVAALVLLVVCVQLSWEISRLEDETRALAEEIAIVRLQVERSGEQ